MQFKILEYVYNYMMNKFWWIHSMTSNAYLAASSNDQLDVVSIYMNTRVRVCLHTFKYNENNATISKGIQRIASHIFSVINIIITVVITSQQQKQNNKPFLMWTTNKLEQKQKFTKIFSN